MGINNLRINAWGRKSLTKFVLTPLDIHIPRRGGLVHYCPQRHTRPGGDLIAGRSSAGAAELLYAVSVRRQERHRSMEESLDEVINSVKVDVEGKTRKKDRSREST